MRCVLGLVSLVLAASCGPSAAVVDAAMDAAAVIAIDAGPTRDAGCDFGAAPIGLPALGGRFVVLDPDAGFAIPAQAGGSPVGVWRVEDVTAFVSSESAAAHDLTGASIGGSAWLVVTSSEVRATLTLDLVVPSASGTMHLPATLALRGPYAWSAVTVRVTPRCAAPAISSLDFDFTSGDSSGTLVLTMSGPVGTMTLLLRCERTST